MNKQSNHFYLLFLLTLIFLVAIPAIHALEKITYYVHDEADMLSQQEEQQIIQIADSLKNSGVAEIAVATINELEPTHTIESKAIELAHGTLGDEEKDNGLLLLISKNDRQYRIEVGYGLEGDIPDLKAAKFAETYLVPEFQNENYGLGVINFLQRVSVELSGDEQLIQQVQEQEQTSKRAALIANLVIFIIFILFFIMMYRNAKKRGLSDSEFMGLVLLGGMHNHGRGSTFSGFGGGGFGGGGFSGGW